MKTLKTLSLLFVAVLAMSSCEKNNGGNDPMPETAGEKTITVDATKYDQWVYIDFNTGKTQALNVKADLAAELKMDWHIALNRYSNVKTNGGEAINTQKQDFNAVTSIPEGAYQKDTEGKILINFRMPPQDEDYIATGVNKAIKYVKGSPMQGNLEASNDVFVIKTKNGRYAKVQFIDFRNKENKTGHITLKYIYPFK